MGFYFHGWQKTEKLASPKGSLLPLVSLKKFFNLLAIVYIANRKKKKKEEEASAFCTSSESTDHKQHQTQPYTEALISRQSECHVQQGHRLSNTAIV